MRNSIRMVKTSLFSLPLTLALVHLAAPSLAVEPASRYRLSIVEPGAYRVPFEKLAAQGMGEIESARLTLTNRGVTVPAWIADGGDGRFGPGDALEFLGERLPGEGSKVNEFSEANVYWLEVQAAIENGGNGSVGASELTQKARMVSPPGPPAVHRVASSTAPYMASQRFEQDLLMMRFAGSDDRRQELWYWAKLTHIDAQPFTQEIDLGDLASSSDRPTRVRVELRGWSRPLHRIQEMTDHRIEVQVDGHTYAAAEWNNEEGERQIEFEIPAGKIAPGKHRISFVVPPRTPPGQRDALIDVIVLNAIEVRYPRVAKLEGDQAVRVEIDGGGLGTLRLEARPATTVTVYGENGSRVSARSMARGYAQSTPTESGLEVRAFALPRDEKALWIVPDGQHAEPVSIEADRASDWTTAPHRADYLAIHHASLGAALDPLLDHHRRLGRTVAKIDVQDLYDELNHGIPHPRAIRDFLRIAYRDWSSIPKWVLLVGDASWDPKSAPPSDDEQFVDATYNPGHGTQFANIGATPYSERARRNLVPTWNYGTFDGHAAGDNWFVDVLDDDLKPEMAIGRLPVVHPEEVSAIVAKILAYSESPELGPWRRDVVWVTNEEAVMQSWSDEMARNLAPRGFAARKVYPAPEIPGTETHEQDQLLQALDQGQLLVHFIGHGGRFIWRTGPPDWTKHRDLFNLSDIDRLTPSKKLPVVLSMTCYSAPFDHPTADSIGEKFLRTPERGAIAVIAASWRNAPYKVMSESLIDELLKSGSTVGEGLMRAKRASSDAEFIRQYNLLGDPALTLAVPTAALALEIPQGESEKVVVARANGGGKLSGQARVDWLDYAGRVLATEESAITNGEWSARYRGPAENAIDVRAARVYAWDSKAGRDALGEIQFPAPPPPPFDEESRP